MPRITVDLSTEEIKNMVLQLPAHEFLALPDAIEERAETIAIMRVSQTGLRKAPLLEAEKIAIVHESVPHRASGSLPSDTMTQVKVALKRALLLSYDRVYTHEP